jgi:integrase
MAGRAGLSAAGKVVRADGVASYLVLDADESEIEPVTAYLRDRMLGDVSQLTCCSYAYDLLRWFRLLWTLDVPWDRAEEADTAALVGWLRRAENPQRRRTRVGSPTAGAINARTGKAEPGLGYAPATIGHALTVVCGFYDFHLHFGRGPLANPVPENTARRTALAHRSPLQPVGQYRRARLRPKNPVRQPRSIPDTLFDELFAQMRNDRDRALVAIYVSSGARASELLGVRIEDVDWAGQRIWVLGKGVRERQPVPASPEAFVYLARYLEQAGLPEPESPLWRTLRGRPRPLTYWAIRQVLERANGSLDTNWTLHDLRHMAAARLASDPQFSLPEVQAIMRHAHMTTTELYTTPRLEDVVDKLAQHYARPTPPTHWSPLYDPEDLRTVFGA